MHCDSDFPHWREQTVELETTHMYRATTPTHIFWFNKVDPEEYFKTILITYVQDDEVLFEKNKEDMTFGVATKCGEQSHYGSITLTQKETNLVSVDSGAPVEIQMRVMDYSGNVDASNKIRLLALDVLNDEVLT